MSSTTHPEVPPDSCSLEGEAHPRNCVRRVASEYSTTRAPTTPRTPNPRRKLPVLDRLATSAPHTTRPVLGHARAVPTRPGFASLFSAAKLRQGAGRAGREADLQRVPPAVSGS